MEGDDINLNKTPNAHRGQEMLIIEALNIDFSGTERFGADCCSADCLDVDCLNDA